MKNFCKNSFLKKRNSFKCLCKEKKSFERVIDKNDRNDLRVDE